MWVAAHQNRGGRGASAVPEPYFARFAICLGNPWTRYRVHLGPWGPKLKKESENAFPGPFGPGARKVENGVEKESK